MKEKVPNGFDLEGMDEHNLGDIIRSRIVRKRILMEASKLIINLRDERNVDAGRQHPGMPGWPPGAHSSIFID